MGIESWPKRRVKPLVEANIYLQVCKSRIEAELSAIWPSLKSHAKSYVRRASSREALFILLISIVTIATHGVWLFNDVIFFDDWLFYGLIHHNKTRALYDGVAWSNAHGQFLPLAAVAFFPDVIFSTRVVSIAATLLSTLFVYEICSRYVGLGREESLLIALMFQCYPAYMVAHCLGMISYTGGLFLFLAAMLLALEAERCKGSAHIALRTGSLVTFFVCFYVNSFLVFYAGFFALYVLLLKKEKRLDWRETARFITVRRADFVLLPLVFWSFKYLYAAVYPTKPGYNEFVWNLREIYAHSADFVWTIIDEMALLLRRPNLVVTVAAFLLLAGRSWWFHRKRQGNADPRQSIQSQLGVLAFGMMLLVLAIAPYVLVGKSPERDTEIHGTRLALLLGIPMALIIVSGSGVLFALLRIGNLWRFPLIMAIVLGFGAARIQHCFMFQRWGILQQSLMAQLRESHEARAAHIYGYVPRMPGNFFVSMGPCFCVPFFLQETFGGALDRYLFREPDSKSDEWYKSRRYSNEEMLQQMQELTEGADHIIDYLPPSPDTSQVTLLFEDVLEMSNWKAGLHYWYFKYLAKDRLPGFVDRAGKLTVLRKQAAATGGTQIPSIEAVKPE